MKTIDTLMDIVTVNVCRRNNETKRNKEGSTGNRHLRERREKISLSCFVLLPPRVCYRVSLILQSLV